MTHDSVITMYCIMLKDILRLTLHKPVSTRTSVTEMHMCTFLMDCVYVYHSACKCHSWTVFSESDCEISQNTSHHSLCVSSAGISGCDWLSASVHGVMGIALFASRLLDSVTIFMASQRGKHISRDDWFLASI